MPQVINYDYKCFELAQEFLEDEFEKELKQYAMYSTWLYEQSSTLAVNIQKVIEEHIQTLKDQKEPKR